MSISLGAAALLGGGSLLGGLLGGAANYATSAEAVKKQIAWERERALNAHQWEVQDLINAGLNPILSSGGSGATTGGISAPQPDMSPIANAIPNAMSAIQAYAQTENTNAQTTQTQANTGLTLEMTKTQAQKTITEMLNQGLITQNTAKALSELNLNQTAISKMKQDLELEQREFNFKIQKIQAEIENAKENKNYTIIKSLSEEENRIRKQKENRIFYMEKTLEHLYKISSETNKWANTGIDFYSRPMEALSRMTPQNTGESTKQRIRLHK